MNDLNVCVTGVRMESSDKNEISSRLIEARKSFNLNQTDFATLVGISKSIYQKYEASVSMPGAHILAKFAKIGINLNWLVSGSGVMRMEDAPQINQTATTSDVLVSLAVEITEAALSKFSLDNRLRSSITLLAFSALQTGQSENSVKQMIFKLVDSIASVLAEKQLPSLTSHETKIVEFLRVATPPQRQILDALLAAQATNQIEDVA